MAKSAHLFPRLFRKIWNRVIQITASFRSSERVFTEIYQKNQWGGVAGEICSGGGTSEPDIADAYIEMISSQARLYGFDQMVFVDLGCGDMAIGKRLIPLCMTYVGVDVVKYVVDRHQAAIGGGNVSFKHGDIVEDFLPDGDVCFIRQVFQHLSNRQILKILPKLKKYRFVFVTEHLPTPEMFLTPNLDKRQGSGIRLDRNSGIKLTLKPFFLPESEVRTVLEISGNRNGAGFDPGLIQTVLYTPGCAWSQMLDISHSDKVK